MKMLDRITWLSAFFHWLVETSLMASVLAALILLFRFFNRTKPSIGFQSVLWWLLILRLLLPIAPESSFSVFNLFSWDSNRTVPSQPSEFIPHNNPAPAIETQLEPSPIGQSTLAPFEIAVPGTGTSRSIPWTLWDIAFFIWLIGVCFSAFGMLRSNYQFLRKIRNGSSITCTTTLRLFGQCKSVIGVKADIPLLETDAESGPTLFGFFRVRLLMPARTWKSFTEDELTCIFYHELAHFRRKDIAFNGLFTGLLILHWFNPILWYAYSRMRDDQELACDHLALSFIPAEHVRNYGHTIIRLAEVFSSTYRTAGIVPFSFGRSQLKKRIQMIKNFRPQARRLSLFGLVTVILLAGGVLTNAKQPSSISSSATVMGLGEPSDTFTPILDDSPDPDLNWVSENEDEQSGDLDAAVISIGGVHLGDTKKNVWSILGEPDEVIKEPTSREDIWQYNKYYAKIYFYKNSPDYPAEGVVRIQMDSPSQWKTESGIGIGDTLQQIKSRYSNLNGKLESASNQTVWVNGGNVAAVPQMYYPTLIFKLHDDKIQQIELSNQNQNPGPYHKKPLSYADMTIGDIRIGASSEEIKSRLGDPSQKDDTMTGPEWTFRSQGIVLGIDPVWLIRVSAPFKGSTPRGIHIGSTKEDVINAYPDAFTDRNSHDGLVQNSTDGTLQIIFEFDNNVVTKIALTRDLVLNHL